MHLESLDPLLFGDIYAIVPDNNDTDREPTSKPGYMIMRLGQISYRDVRLYT